LRCPGLGYTSRNRNRPRFSQEKAVFIDRLTEQKDDEMFDDNTPAAIRDDDGAKRDNDSHD